MPLFLHTSSFFILSRRCLKFLGTRHPTLVLPIVPELLSTHPYFDTPEPDMDDPACILPGSAPLSLCNRVIVLKGNKRAEQWGCRRSTSVFFFLVCYVFVLLYSTSHFWLHAKTGLIMGWKLSDDFTWWWFFIFFSWFEFHQTLPF